jgi:hypothetical protein
MINSINSTKYIPQSDTSTLSDTKLLNAVSTKLDKSGTKKFTGDLTVTNSLTTANIEVQSPLNQLIPITSIDPAHVFNTDITYNSTGLNGNFSFNTFNIPNDYTIGTSLTFSFTADAFTPGTPSGTVQLENQTGSVIYASSNTTYTGTGPYSVTGTTVTLNQATLASYNFIAGQTIYVRFHYVSAINWNNFHNLVTLNYVSTPRLSIAGNNPFIPTIIRVPIISAAWTGSGAMTVNSSNGDGRRFITTPPSAGTSSYLQVDMGTVNTGYYKMSSTIECAADRGIIDITEANTNLALASGIDSYTSLTFSRIFYELYFTWTNTGNMKIKFTMNGTHNASSTGYFAILLNEVILTSRSGL